MMALENSVDNKLTSIRGKPSRHFSIDHTEINRKHSSHQEKGVTLWRCITPPTHTNTQEEHHQSIELFQAISELMQNQRYNMEGMTQANTVMTRSKSAVMEQYAQLTAAMGAMQAHLNILSLS